MTKGRHFNHLKGYSLTLTAFLNVPSLFVFFTTKYWFTCERRIFMTKLKFLPTISAKVLIQFTFLISSLFFRINQRKITFASYRTSYLKDNLLFIYEEIKKAHPEYKCTFLFKKFDSSPIGKIQYLIHMIVASYQLATSKYFIIDDFYFPVYVIKPRKGMNIIQLWHAAGAFKKFGLSTINKSFGPSIEYLRKVKIHSNYTKVFVSSSTVIPFYAEAFDMSPNRIYPLGVPRTDYFFIKDKHIEVRKKFFEENPELQGKKLILYAPTFRGKSHYQKAFRLPFEFSEMKKILSENFAILIHLHPFMQSNLDINDSYKGFVYHIIEGYDIQELLVISDILVTDYSSVIFDFSLLEKPIAFLANDLEEYIKERDFYYDYISFIPGPLFTESISLSKWICEGNYDLDPVRDFRAHFFDHLDGNASRRIVDNILAE